MAITMVSLQNHEGHFSTFKAKIKSSIYARTKYVSDEKIEI